MSTAHLPSKCVNLNNCTISLSRSCFFFFYFVVVCNLLHSLKRHTAVSLRKAAERSLNEAECCIKEPLSLENENSFKLEKAATEKTTVNKNFILRVKAAAVKQTVNRSTQACSQQINTFDEAVTCTHILMHTMLQHLLTSEFQHLGSVSRFLRGRREFSNRLLS